MEERLPFPGHHERYLVDLTVVVRGSYVTLPSLWCTNSLVFFSVLVVCF